MSHSIEVSHLIIFKLTYAYFFVKIVELGVKKLKLLDGISKLEDNAANTRIAHQIDVHANQLQINSLISEVNLINVRIRLAVALSTTTRLQNRYFLFFKQNNSYKR